MTLPTADGGSNQVLKTDGSGNLSEFTYQESDEVASAQGYIEIVIRPDENGNSFKFSD